MNENELAGLIDVAGLQRFLEAELPAINGPLFVERLRAGYSNETFSLSYGPERFVLRRPPRGELLPTSHDVLREYRTISALHGTSVPVPRPIAACEDARVIGAPFYLMEHVDGIVIRESSPSQFEGMEARRRIGEELIDTLANLHSIDWQRTALRPSSDPARFLARQLRRWKEQIELTLPRTRPLPGLRDATVWLEGNLPATQPPAIVHGDYKLDNVILNSSLPVRIRALLDWEMLTIGDPLTDLGWCLAYWGPTGDPAERMWQGNNAVTMRPGYASRAELVERYERCTGRAVVNFQFYLCLAVWRQAIICEGLYRHFLEGTAPNPATADMEWVVPRIVERLHRIIDGDIW